MLSAEGSRQSQIDLFVNIKKAASQGDDHICGRQHDKTAG
jgi:hypothetical protein